MSRQSVLRRELRSAGAKPAELDQLAGLAEKLQQLQPAEAVTSLRWLSFFPIGVTAIVAVAFGMALVTLSQTSLPGNVLYPVKHLSERVAVAIDPDYRGVVMMQRAQEVQKLIAVHANSRLVLATLADYRSQAAAYKTAGTNYSVFEFCKSSLQQAQAAANTTERQAIGSTLDSLKDV